MEQVLFGAMVLGLLILAASVASAELRLSIAVVEVGLGVVAGNVFDLRSTQWLDLLAAFGAVLLVFLAGSEVDPTVLRTRWKQSVLVGGLSFAGPFVVTLLLARVGLGWDLRAAEIAACAMSGTSLAVVYVVLLESGGGRTELGKLMMAAVFVTDLATAIALTALFVRPTVWMLPFVVVSAALIVGMPALQPWLLRRYGARVTEPGLKAVFAALLVLMYLGLRSESHAVLPAFLLGLALAPFLGRHPVERERMRIVAFAFFTPLFFLRSGMNVSLPAVWANLGLFGLFLAAKVGGKIAAVYPAARRVAPGAAAYLTLLMSTGLTFGTLSALYGLQAGIIDQSQFSVLAAVIVVTAIVPTAIAVRYFSPNRPAAGPEPSAPDEVEA